MKNSIYIILSLLVFGCSSSSTENAAPTDTQDNMVVMLTDQQMLNSKISTARLNGGELNRVLKLNGSIESSPLNTVSVTMPLGGYIKNSMLLPGTKVSKGQVLFQMDDPQYIQLQQDYLTAKTRLNYLELELQRQTELNATKAASDKVLQQTQMEYSNQKILTGALTEKLKIIHINTAALNEKNISGTINIPAPISGYVSKVNFNNGKYVGPTDIIAEIINSDKLTLQLQAFEKDLGKLKIGQHVIAYNNNSAKKYSCSIELISQNFNAERTVTVTCKFDDPATDLYPGMYMNGEIEIENANSFNLPESAIVSFEGKSYVFLARANNQYYMQEVKTGIISEGAAEILNYQELANHDVVTEGAYTLLMALKNKSED